MERLSRQQCRAARGLLGWTQQDLADQTRLSKTAINNFERGLSNVKSRTLNLIYQALTQEGILFLEHDGLQRRKDSLFVTHGPQAFDALFDDILLTTKERDQLILISTYKGITNKKYFKAGLTQLKKHKLKTQVISHENKSYATIINFCYGFKLGLYYPQQRVTVIIENIHAHHAEKSRLQSL